MYNGLDLLKSKIFYSGIGRSGIALEQREEELMHDIINAGSIELKNKLIDEFYSKISLSAFENYVNTLERCKNLVLAGVTDFDVIRKLIMKNMDVTYLRAKTIK